MHIRLFTALFFIILIAHPLQGKNGIGATFQNETLLFVIQSKMGEFSAEKTLKLCELSNQAIYFGEVDSDTFSFSQSLRKAGAISLEKMLSILEERRLNIKKPLVVSLLIPEKSGSGFSSIPITLTNLEFDKKTNCLTGKVQYMGDLKPPIGSLGEIFLFADLPVSREYMMHGSTSSDLSS